MAGPLTRSVRSARALLANRKSPAVSGGASSVGVTGSAAEAGAAGFP
jgi:hypothetical protein